MIDLSATQPRIYGPSSVSEAGLFLNSKEQCQDLSVQRIQLTATLSARLHSNPSALNPGSLQSSDSLKVVFGVGLCVAILRSPLTGSTAFACQPWRAQTPCRGRRV